MSTYIDQRVRVSAFKAEQTLTKDTVPVNVDAVVYWTVWDVEKAALEVQEYQKAIEHITQTGLRDTIGKHELSDLLQERDKICGFATGLRQKYESVGHHMPDCRYQRYRYSARPGRSNE